MKFSMKSENSLAVCQTLSWPVVTWSALVALIVGTILNGINQGSEIQAGEPVNISRILLTYVVPFCVATYGAYAAFCGLDTGPVCGSRHGDSVS